MPGRSSMRASRARIVKAGDEQRMFQRAARVWPGIALLAAGAALSQLGPLAGLPVFGYAAIAWLLRYLAAHTLGVFVAYRIPLGVLVLALAATGAIS